MLCFTLEYPKFLQESAVKWEFFLTKIEIFPPPTMGNWVLLSPASFSGVHITVLKCSQVARCSGPGPGHVRAKLKSHSVVVLEVDP